LSVLDFVKLITVQQYDQAALSKLGRSAIVLAEAEGLVGHADAIRARAIKGAQPAKKPRKGKSRV
jgi:histidinol dehydrogenase